MPPYSSVILTCQYCGQPFKATPTFVKRGARFCSLLCGNRGKRRISLVDRFWKKVSKTTGCWLWKGASRHASGYGMIYRRQDGHKVIDGAHRVSWLLHYGPVPAALYVCHHCDVPACVRPDHLFLGTHSDNMADMSAKGRSLRGARSTLAILTVSQVADIRHRYRPYKVSAQKLADEYGVHRQTIFNILHNKSWRDSS